MNEAADLRAISFSLGSSVGDVDIFRQRFSVLYLVNFHKLHARITGLSRFVKFCSTPGGNLIEVCSYVLIVYIEGSSFLEQSRSSRLSFPLGKEKSIHRRSGFSFKDKLEKTSSLQRRSQKAVTRFQ